MPDPSQDPMFDRRTIVAGVDIPFGHLVVLLVKLALAAVPAMFVLIMLAGVLIQLLGGLGGLLRGGR